MLHAIMGTVMNVTLYTKPACAQFPIESCVLLAALL